MIALLRRRLTRQRRKEASTDWQATLKSRMRVAAAVLALWALAIECRLVYLQIIARADLVERGVAG